MSLYIIIKLEINHFFQMYQNYLENLSISVVSKNKI